MDFNLKDEQTMFKDSVAAFAARNLRDGALERAHSDDYPWDVAREMAKALAYTLAKRAYRLGEVL